MTTPPVARTRPLLVLGCCALLGACIADPSPRARGDAQSAPGPVGAWPFAPATLRIHPLTHVDPPTEPGKGGVLFLHFELRDAFGDAVKGVGSLHVELDRPGGDALTWDVPDMNDPASNTRRFDPPTRTYRVPLQTPVRLTEYLRSGGARVRASLTTEFADGSRRTIGDDFTLEP
ncbi:MAG TPA: hypothetical protein VD971_10935 [Phycisphaerales bacterium]|nr:hypothetical protein [Phycisphaerales bacterium]